MADRPILFSAPMVAALLDGRKTQTRRLLSPQPFSDGYFEGEIDVTRVDYPSIYYRFGATAVGGGAVRTEIADQRFDVGDRLWVKETYYQRGDWIEDPTQMTKVRGVPKWCFRPIDDEISFEAPAEYRTGWQQGPGEAIYRRLGRFMPRRYSRLTLLVTDVRVERLNDISEADALAEGLKRVGSNQPPELGPQWSYGGDQSYFDPRAAYAALWDSINTDPGKRWDDNPWIVAVTFEVAS